MAVSSYLLLCIALICLSTVSAEFRVTDCDSQLANELVTINSIRVSPDPLPFPGTIRVSWSVTLNRAMSGNIGLEATVWTSGYFGWTWLPCFGNCEISDLCRELDEEFGSGDPCPSWVTEAGLPCTCPIPAGTYSMNDVSIDLPKLPSFISEGEYKFEVKLKDSDSDEDMACQVVYVEIDEQ